MLLTDNDILKYMKDGYIDIKPFDRKQLGSNSYDLTLSEHLLIYACPGPGEFILDCKKDNPVQRFTIPEEGFVLQPGELYLGSTIEHTISKGVMPYISGKSSIGRLGIAVHITAGTGDVGFRGHWTLEITVVKPVRIYAGMPIAQILYNVVLGKCDVPYALKPGQKYSEQNALPQPSQMFKNFQKETV